jgi:ectoine hydroxylase-related dioxygenase (phytanoyl-CoA dioxygenase family)
VTLDVPAGSRVLFHQALWHAAFPNRSHVTRKAIYYSYSPFWLRPIDRSGFDEAALHGKTVTPLMRQLLSDQARPLDFWLPKVDDLPLKQWHDARQTELAIA